MTDDSGQKKDDGDGENGDAPDTPLEEATSIIEWATAAIGAVIFVGMVVYLAVAAVTEMDGAPKIAFSTTAPIRQDGGFLVAFKATNTGLATATSLVVAARLMEGETEIEHREVTIDYLPVQSSRGGGLFFRRDPGRYRLEIEAQSYLDP